MADIVLHSAWHLPLDPHEAAEAKPYPPLGTVTLATELRNEGIDAAVWDATFEADPARFAQALEQHRPRRVAIVPDHHAIPVKMTLVAQREAAFAAIRLAKAAGCEVMATGPDASDHPERYQAAGADIVVRGEADLPVLAWARGEELPPEVDAAPRDVAEVPAVDWSQLDLTPYRDTWRAAHGVWEMPVSSNRGCPYRCNWCAKPTWGRSLQQRPPEAVLADCRRVEAVGADRIWFSDDIFALKPSWLRQFREEVQGSRPILPFRCQTRVDLVSRGPYLDDLAATGCVETWMGAESGAQHVLDAMDKDATVDQIYTAVRRCQQRGVRVGLFLQLGYPGESLADVKRTIGMVRELRPDQIGISVSYPLPGTAFYAQVRSEMHDEEKNWHTAMDNRVLFRGTYPQRFYDVARQVLRSEHAVLQGVAAAGRIASRKRRARDLRRVASALLRHGPRLPALHAQLRVISRQTHGRAAPTTD